MSQRQQQLSDRQQQIVGLIEEGFLTYDTLAEEMDMSRSTLRDEVVRLCARFDCDMRHLPEKAALDNSLA